MPLGRNHGALCAQRIRRAGNHTPRLCDRVDAALAARGGTKRRSVIEIPSPIPFTIPGLALDGVPEGSGMLPPCHAPCLLTTVFGHRSEGLERGKKEPGEPHAFTPSRRAYPIHAVIPVTRSNQRQAVGANSEASVESQRAMLEQRGLFSGNQRL